MSTLNVNTINAAPSGQAVAVDISNPRSFRNLIINGAMQVAQRGTSSTDHGHHTVDRWAHYRANVDENPTFSQADVASGTTPYELGFRKSLKTVNGNQTGGAGGSDYISLDYKWEAQDIANSGWNYTSTSSYVTFSFWVKSSVAQNFYFHLKTVDGTSQNYPMETGTLSANTWTKITKTIPGDSDLQFDNNNDTGLQMRFMLYRGTTNTGSITLNQWGAWNGSVRVPDNTTTWYTTNDATFELTGAQFEVGSYATDFEHRSYGVELRRCQRYYQIQAGDSDAHIEAGKGQGSASVDVGHALAVPLRAEPTVTLASNRVFRHDGYSDSTATPTVIQWNDKSPMSSIIAFNLSGHSGITSNYVTNWCPKAANLKLNSEL